MKKLFHYTSLLLLFAAVFLTNAAQSENRLPIIYSVVAQAPGSGTSGYVGCKVVIRGIGFSDTKTLTIGDVTVGDFTIESDNVITFKAIAASGTVSIRRTTGEGAYFGTEYKNLGVCLPGVRYEVSGGGKFCDDTGGSVGLPYSQDGFDYHLFCNGADTGRTVKGTGNAIIFDHLTATGNYTITAVNVKCKVVSEMKGKALVKLAKGKIGYLDADGDGFGNPSISKKSCDAELPKEYVAGNTDCDDSNAAIAPNAAEIKGNGIDDNCDGRTDENTAPKETVKPTAPRKTARSEKLVNRSTCYPNPFGTVFTLNVNANRDVIVKVYDIVGKLLDTIEVAVSAQQKKFELGADYPSGVYRVVMVFEDDSTKVFPIIKR